MWRLFLSLCRWIIVISFNALALNYLFGNSFLLVQSSSTPPTRFNLPDIIDKEVNVLVDPIRLLVENGTARPAPEMDRKPPICVLELYKDNDCETQRIRVAEKIRWDTRICFKWRCIEAEKYAMRIEDCWTGSARNPMQLIDRFGCTREGTLISPPIYRPGSQSAQSLGWLTVRLLNADHVRLSCAIRLCPICEQGCRAKILPRNCAEQRGRRGEEWWRNRVHLDELCGAEVDSAKDGGRAKSANGWNFAPYLLPVLFISSVTIL